MQKNIIYGIEYQYQKQRYQDYLGTLQLSKEPDKEIRMKGQRPRTGKGSLCGIEFQFHRGKYI